MIHELGVNYPMLADTARLKFYDAVCQDAAGCDVIDVGAGTGILSYLALKHGATHVTAIEKHPVLAGHLVEIFDQLGYKNVTVIQDDYRNVLPGLKADFIVQEMFSSDVLFEGVNQIVEHTDIPVYPNQVNFRFYQPNLEDVDFGNDRHYGIAPDFFRVQKQMISRYWCSTPYSTDDNLFADLNYTIGDPVELKINVPESGFVLIEPSLVHKNHKMRWRDSASFRQFGRWFESGVWYLYWNEKRFWDSSRKRLA